MKQVRGTMREIEGTGSEGQAKSIDERLKNNPVLRARIEAILGIVENEDGTIEKADDAEQRAIEGLRKLGNEVMHEWAKRLQQKKSEEMKGSSEVRRSGKKNSGGGLVLGGFR